MMSSFQSWFKKNTHMCVYIYILIIQILLSLWPWESHSKKQRSPAPLRTCVRLHGLNKAELNGSRAEVMEVDVPAGRYLVHLQNGKQIKAGTQINCYGF